MNARPFFTIFLLALCASAALASETITDKELSISRSTVQTAKDAVFTVKPEPYSHITITLSGSKGFTPSLMLIDTDAEETLAQVTATDGGNLTVTYTVGENKREPKNYTISFNEYGYAGATYLFTYRETLQDDAGTGADSPRDFKRGPLLKSGTYEGFVGNEDTIDYYSLSLVGGEEVSFTLRMLGKGTLRFTLIDGDYNTRIDQKTHINENEIITHYASTKTQTVWIGVEGDTPYTLTASSDRQLEPEPVVAVAVEQQEDSEPAPVAADEIAMTSDGSSRASGTIILVVAVVLVVALAIFTIWRRKDLKKEEVEEEKKAGKDEEKKKSEKKK